MTTEWPSRELVLQRLDQYVQTAFPQRYLKRIQVHEPVIDYALRQVVYSFESYVMGNTIHTERLKTEVPITWWDFLKQSLPDWFQRRFPVRRREIVTETKFVHVCPHIDVGADREAHLRWLAPPVTLRMWEEKP